jgi:hypothetical protein
MPERLPTVRIAAGNCLEKRADERFIAHPFSLARPAVGEDGPGR